MYRIIFIMFYLLVLTLNASLSRDDLQHYIKTPYSIGKKDSIIPVWEVLDGKKKLHSYLFETYDYAQIPGFAGEKINLLVQMDINGSFLDINVLEQDEPVFVSGLGVEPFVKFLKQYKGKSLKNGVKIRTPRGPRSPIHIDGITKATASVQIANDLILGSSTQVAKQKLFIAKQKKIYFPKKELFEKHTWKEMLEKKLITHTRVTKSQMENLFVRTSYIKKLTKDEEDDVVLDFYVADVTLPSISKNLLSKTTRDDIHNAATGASESILIFANGPYRLISDDFIPATSPDDIELTQDGFSLNIKDGNYDIEFLEGIPEFSQVMLLEVDRRYNFDPSSVWSLRIKVKRGAGSIFFTPVVRHISMYVDLPKRYFNIPKAKLKPKAEKKEKVITSNIAKIEIKQKSENSTQPNESIINSKEITKTTNNELLTSKIKQELKQEIMEELRQEIKAEILSQINITSYKPEAQIQPSYMQKQESKTPFWLRSIYEQKTKLISLTLFLTLLFILLHKYQSLLSKLRYKRAILLGITLFFIGWYGQGQLSIVSVIGVLKAIYNSHALTFLLYDPFSLIIWFFVFLSLFIWGRGTFCGWLCPYGVLQEFSYRIGRVLRLPKLKVPHHINSKLVYIKYFILGALVLSVFAAPSFTKYLLEIEPFKTSITLGFDREIPYVVYALFWLFLGMFLFKGFCRYFCPLGAFLSIAGKLRVFNWLPRRVECGNPCNNCSKKCLYQAIDKKDGHINYTDCFQCLDCVEIYSDEKLCKILLKNSNKEVKITKWSVTNG